MIWVTLFAALLWFDAPWWLFIILCGEIFWWLAAEHL